MRFQANGVGREASGSPVHSLVCLLLVALLLHNPFIALILCHGGLTVQHPPSNRSTVGSSELQHFTPVAKDFEAAISPFVCLGEIFVQLAERESAPAIDTAPEPVALSGFSSNLWFRPPPFA